MALAALGWLLGDGERGQRFLDLTGLTPESLRSAIGETSTHRAVFEFLESHEPDLLATADALGVRPEELIRAGQELDR